MGEEAPLSRTGESDFGVKLLTGVALQVNPVAARLMVSLDNGVHAMVLRRLVV